MASAVAAELIVIGADTTPADAVGSAERLGLVSMFARPSTLAMMAKTYVLLGWSVGNVAEVFAVKNLPAGRYPRLPSLRVAKKNASTL